MLQSRMEATEQNYIDQAKSEMDKLANKSGFTDKDCQRFLDFYNSLPDKEKEPYKDQATICSTVLTLKDKPKSQKKVTLTLNKEDYIEIVNCVRYCLPIHKGTDKEEYFNKLLSELKRGL